MNCLFCGAELGFNVFFVGDRDFCLPSHRRKYHDRLRKGLTQIEETAVELPEVANFLSAPSTASMVPCNADHRMCSMTPVAAPFRSRQLVGPWHDNLEPVVPELPEPATEEVPEPVTSILQFVAPPPATDAVADEKENSRLDLANRLSSIRADLRRKRLRPPALAAC